MVQIEQNRISSKTDLILKAEISPKEVLLQFLVYEFEYDGLIFFIGRKKLMVQTEMKGSTDIFTFSGNQKEMQPLVKASSSDFKKSSFGQICNSNILLSEFDKITFLLKELSDSDIRLSEKELRIRIAAMWGMGIEDLEVLKSRSSLRLKELFKLN